MTESRSAKTGRPAQTRQRGNTEKPKQFKTTKSGDRNAPGRNGGSGPPSDSPREERGPPTEVPCTLLCSARGITATSHRELTKFELCCPDGCWATVPKSTVINYELPAEELIHEMSGENGVRAHRLYDLLGVGWPTPPANPRWASALFGFGTALFLPMSRDPFDNGGFGWNPPQQTDRQQHRQDKPNRRPVHEDDRPKRTTQLGRNKPLTPRPDIRTAADEIHALGVNDWATNPWARTTVEQYIRQRERDGFLLVQLRGEQRASPPAILGLLSAERQTILPGWTVKRYYAQRGRPLLRPEWPCVYLGGGTVGSSRKSRAKQAGGWRPWRYGMEHVSWSPLDEMCFQSEQESREADGALVSPNQLDESAAFGRDEPPEQQQHHQQQPPAPGENSAKHSGPTPPPPPERDSTDENAAERDPSPWGGFGKTPPRRPKAGLNRPSHQPTAHRVNSGQEATPIPPPWEEETIPPHHLPSPRDFPSSPPLSLPPFPILPPTSSSTNRPPPFSSMPRQQYSLSNSTDPYPSREWEPAAARRTRLMRSTSILAEDIREELIRQQHKRAGQPVASWRETADGRRLVQMLEQYQNGAAKLNGGQRQALQQRFPELPPPLRRPVEQRNRPTNSGVPRLASVVVSPPRAREETGGNPEQLAEVLEKLKAEEAARREAAETERRHADRLQAAREKLEAVIRRNDEEERAQKAQRAAELKKAAEEERARKGQRAAELKKATDEMNDILAGAKWSGDSARTTTVSSRKIRVGRPGASKSTKEIDVVSLAETEEEEVPPPGARGSVAKSRKFGNESSVLVFNRRPDGTIEGREVGANQGRRFDRYGEIGNGEEEEEEQWK
uniref:Reverse transcriptase domain-containing protein n=1 Tax=Globodera pallida TaxID=36090 RepID=A0A183C3V5_GLOPA